MHSAYRRVTLSPSLEPADLDVIKPASVTLAKPVSLHHYQNVAQRQFPVIPAPLVAITRSSFSQKREGA
jgi:hypothetical protein